MSNSPKTNLLREAMALHRRGALAEAAVRYAAVLRADPANADAHYYLATISCQRAQFAEGVAHARNALVHKPRHAGAHDLLGCALNALGRRQEALASFERAIAITPKFAPAHSHRADALGALGRYAEAVESYDRALATAPDNVADWFNRSVALAASNRPGDAVASIDRVIAKKPDFVQAHLWRAKLLADLRRHGDALEGIDKLLAIAPGLAEAWLGRSNILFELKRYEEALAACDRALALKSDLVEAWHGRGNVLLPLMRCDEALAAYNKALSLSPGSAEAWHGQGTVLSALNRYEEALAAYDKAVGLRPDLAEAWLGRGNVQNELGRWQQAFAAFDRALELRPDLAEAWLGRGNVHAKVGRYDDALASHDKALALDPTLVEAWLGRGNVLTELKRYDEALAAFDGALALQPGLGYAVSARLNLKLQMSDWIDLESELARFLAPLSEPMPLKDGALGLHRRLSPLILSRFTDDPAILLRSAARWVQDHAAYAKPFASVSSPSSERIRLGYVSQDFRDQVTGLGYVEMFERHDRSRFALFGFSLSADDGSAVRKRIARAFDHFHDVSALDDVTAARRIHELGIDVLVEMVPHSLGSRPAILAFRPAPIAVNAFTPGYSAGASFVDYVVTDQWMLPFANQPYFVEKIVHLPHTCFGHDSTQVISARTPVRSDEGLPEHGVVFCCFNASYKITPQVFAVWMNLLREVPGSVLWLARNNDFAVANLRREAGRLGIDPARLVFAERMPAMADHLARHRLADLFLDTLPYNAQSTAMDALWAGLPVLTCAGRSYTGRFAMSQLHNIGLPELVTEDLAGYEQLALVLARDPQRLRELRARLERNRLTTPLFDTRRLCRELEAAYATMVDIWRRGESPRSFSVEAE